MTTAPQANPPYIPLADALREQGRINDIDLARAQRLQRETSGSLNIILTKLGLISEQDLGRSMAAHTGLPIATSDDFPSTPVEGLNLSPTFLKEFLVLPMSLTEEGLRVAMADAEDQYALKAMTLAQKTVILPHVSEVSVIETALNQFYNEAPSHPISDDLDEATEDDIARLKGLASEEPIIKLVNAIIAEALDSQASDIHIEPFEHTLSVRMRIDGRLRPTSAPPHHQHLAIVSRIKIMAELDIAERRLPQDGRIKMTVRGQDTDMRISTMPSHHGEGVVIRLLKQDETQLDFTMLGFSPSQRDVLRTMLNAPTGIVLVTGPTGSGKTTTLYTAVRELNIPERKIVTVEDPVEYEFDGVLQIHAQPEIGRDFATVLRGFLRHDPDIIMVGEIRDTHTAQIAAHAAQTGHLVLSTLHTRDAVGAITRLLDLGVPPYQITATLNGIVAQRLVRVLCQECREPGDTPASLKEHVERAAHATGIAPQIYQAKGCARCGNTGYHGRTVITELCEFTSIIDNLDLKAVNADAIRDAARAHGMTTMFEDGIAKATHGITSLDEVITAVREV